MLEEILTHIESTNLQIKKLKQNYVGKARGKIYFNTEVQLQRKLSYYNDKLIALGSGVIYKFEFELPLAPIQYAYTDNPIIRYEKQELYLCNIPPDDAMKLIKIKFPKAIEITYTIIPTGIPQKVSDNKK